MERSCEHCASGPEMFRHITGSNFNVCPQGDKYRTSVPRRGLMEQLTQKHVRHVTYLLPESKWRPWNGGGVVEQRSSAERRSLRESRRVRVCSVASAEEEEKRRAVMKSSLSPLHH
ncbi:hypothetical protein F2P81_020749 [Scophthalmus maximus]|uniref:Uncharacterized protein n=1 Tax=Scophthalmus maximus TaxID=52904 RepID=A0A6A4S3V7_SCOMX|nr:hypothetical protein F2P81_020749 [Scophthalmus maximus]